MNITIETGAAIDDAKNIDDIVAAMEQDMITLDNAIKATIADGPGDSGILTKWSSTVKANWGNYSANDIPNTFADMKLSAANLRIATEEATKYSMEVQ